MKSLNERVTPQDLSQVETYVDKLFGKIGVDVEFTKHFLDRVNDRRNQKPITTAELIRIFRETYKEHGKKIPKMGPEAQAVLRDLKTDVNIPFVLEVDKDGELDMISKTIMRKKDFKSSNPILTVENIMKDKEAKRILEGINSDTVSKKFFQMLLDTLEDFENDEDADLSDHDRAGILATLLNAEAKKYLKGNQWRDVINILQGKHSKGVDVTPSMATPSPAERFGGPGRFGESKVVEAAPAVEFFTDPASGEVRAEIGNKVMDLKSFVKRGADDTGVTKLVRALQNKIADKGKDPYEDFKGFIKKYFYQRDDNPDVLVREHPADEDKKTVQFDTDEIKTAKKMDDEMQGYLKALGEINHTDHSDLELLEKLKKALDL